MDSCSRSRVARQGACIPGRSPLGKPFQTLDCAEVRAIGVGGRRQHGSCFSCPPRATPQGRCADDQSGRGNATARRPPNQFGRNGRLRSERSICRGSRLQIKHDRKLGNFRCPHLGRIYPSVTVPAEWPGQKPERPRRPTASAPIIRVRTK